MNAELREIERRARETPDDPVARLAYARALARIGHRAAAAHELSAAQRLGWSIPQDLRDAVAVSVRSEGGVAASDVGDARFPGAFDGDLMELAYWQRTPLVVVLSRAGRLSCDECDGRGEHTCRTCEGRGPEMAYGWMGCGDCDNVGALPCPACHGVGVSPGTPRTSSCAHVFSAEHSPSGNGSHSRALDRCELCGLAAMVSYRNVHHMRTRHGVVRHPACSECGLFGCSCGP